VAAEPGAAELYLNLGSLTIQPLPSIPTARKIRFESKLPDLLILFSNVFYNETGNPGISHQNQRNCNGMKMNLK
jgi:hypothetical protein